MFKLFNVAEGDKCNPFIEQPNGALTFKYTSELKFVNINAQSQLEQATAMPPNAAPFKASAVLTLRGIRQCDRVQPSLRVVNVVVTKIIIEQQCEALAFEDCYSP